MAKKDRMGSGLDMLFEDNFSEAQSSDNSPSSLRISMIEPDRSQPRKNFDNEALKELSENIALHGVLQPILVRPIGDGIYRIVAGERRWRAARMAGISEIPAVVKELTDAEAAQISLIENIQRKDLDPIEEAAAYKRLMDEFGMKQEALSKALGRSRSTITNSLRLLNLEKNIQKMVAENKISMSHAKIIVGIDSADMRQKLAMKACEGCSVKELQNYVVKLKQETDNDAIEQVHEFMVKNIFDNKDPWKKFIIDSENAFNSTYGVPTKVRKERTGNFTVKFTVKNEDELSELVKRLTDGFEASEMSEEGDE